MKPFILRYKEKINSEDEGLFSNAEYSSDLNLTIDKITGLPFILGEVAQASTITHSKAGAESTDKDQEGRIQSMMATMTKTDANREASDSDPARITLGINTHTYTETNRETTDQDK